WAARHDRALLSRHTGYLDLPVRRAVLDVYAAGIAPDVDRARSLARSHAFCPERLLPLPVPGRRVSRLALQSHRVSHQALVGMQHLQNLREGLRVGRHSWSEDSGDRVRPLRRLRAPLPG